MKKKLTILLTAFMLVFAMTACGGKDASADKQGATSSNTAQSTEKTAQNISVTFSIDYPDQSKDVEDVKVTVPANSSALGVLQTYAKKNNIELSIDEISDPPYIKGINGVIESDTSGWIYELNDEMSMKAAGECTMHDGDHLEWEYVNWGDLDD